MKVMLIVAAFIAVYAIVKAKIEKKERNEKVNYYNCDKGFYY